MGYTEYVLSQNPTYEFLFDLHTGIDEFLAKILYVDFVHYGFKSIYTDPFSPLDLNVYYDLGNWTVYDIINGPDAISGILPATIIISKNGNLIMQAIPWMLDIYYRYSEVDEAGVPIEWSEWETKSNLKCPVYIGSDEPTPESNYCIWIDTSYGDAPTFRAYHSEIGWFSVGSLIDVLYTNIYDEDNRRQDIFWYFEKINGIVKEIDGEWVPANPLDLRKDKLSLYNLRARFFNHFRLGHMSEDERQVFEALLSDAEINDMISETKKLIFNYLNDKIAQMSLDLIHQIHYDDFNAFMDHYRNENIHTTDFRSGWWNSKSDGDHGHYLDGKIFISADDVIEGYVSIDRMPDTAIDRLTSVLTHKDRFALKRKQVQNGDSVYVHEETDIYEQGLYIVYDMYNLDNDNGWLFYRCRCIANIDFDDIRGLPTTLSGYRISDGNLVVKATALLPDTGESNCEFVYPYHAKDKSMNYKLTTEIMQMDEFLTIILDEIEKKITEGDPLGTMNAQIEEQLQKLASIRERWDPYRRVKGNYIRDAYNINAERIQRIEAKYEEIFGMAYDAKDYIPLSACPELPEDVTDNESRYEEFVNKNAIPNP